MDLLTSILSLDLFGLQHWIYRRLALLLLRWCLKIEFRVSADIMEESFYNVIYWVL